MQRPVITDWKRPNYEPVYRFRNWNLARLRAGGQPAWDAAFAYYREHPVEAIEDWVTTYDPRLVNRGLSPYIPFMLFPKQKECVNWLRGLYMDQVEGLIEKSRECGISWLCLSFAWWLWTFYDGVTLGFGSRKEDFVDRVGDPDSLFQKFRLIVQHLPTEMKPIGWNPVEDQPRMRLKNRETGSALIGQGGRNIGRGGRASMYFIDEAAFLEYPEEADAALSATSDAKVWLSTVNGTGNSFYRKRFSGAMPVFIFDWRDDPRKDEEWYLNKKETLEPEVLAQEVDRDYEATDSQIAVPSLWVRASRDLRKLLEQDGLLPARPIEGPIVGLDVATGGAAKSVVVPRAGALVDPCIAWSDEDTIDVAGRACHHAKDAGAWLLNYDSIGVGRGVAAAFRRMSGVGIKFVGVNAGDRPTRERWPDERRADQKFVNLKAELWWKVRDALRRTYEHYLFYTDQGGVARDVDDLLLLPEDEKMCAELSLPRYFHTETGKIQIESKRQMASRGVASPDRADALILTYAPRKNVKRSNRARSRW